MGLYYHILHQIEQKNDASDTHQKQTLSICISFQKVFGVCAGIQTRAQTRMRIRAWTKCAVCYLCSAWLIVCDIPVLTSWAPIFSPGKGIYKKGRSKAEANKLT